MSQFAYNYIFRQPKQRLDLLLSRLDNETELEYLDLLGVPFFVELCMQDTFPDLHERLLQNSDSGNLYEPFISNDVTIEVKSCFLRLARRCFRINNRLKAKTLNIETLLCRKYSNKLVGRIPKQGDENLDEGNTESDTYSTTQRILFEIVYEVEKGCGMQG